MPRLISFAVAEGLLNTPVDARACRVCGCTDADCSGCVKRTGMSCYWMEADLCSACAPVPSDLWHTGLMSRAKSFVDELTVWDLWAIAATAAIPGQPELEVEFLLDTFFATRRGLVAKSKILTCTNSVRVGASVELLTRAPVVQSRTELEAFPTGFRNLFRVAASAPRLAPFVFVGPCLLNGPQPPHPSPEENR